MTTIQACREVTKTKTTEEWLERFSRHHVAAGRINTVEAAFQDPGVQATGMVKTMNHPKAGRIKVLDTPWRLSAAPDGLRLPPPPLGYHTTEVLLAAGYASGEIEALKQTGAVSGE